MGTSKIYGILLAFLTTLFLLAPKQVLGAELFEYRMDDVYGRSERAQCESFVRDTAAKFTEQTGITPFAHGCRQDTVDTKILEGVISYFADERVPVLSSRDRRAGLDNEGGYPSAQDCRAALPARTEQFETIYGVEVLASWCFPLYSSSSVYAARIEAIGTSDIKSVIVGFSYYGRLTASPRSVLAAIRSAAEQKFPGHVADASLQGNLASVRATVRYYSSVRHFLNNMDEMKFATTAACEEAAQDVLALFEDLAEKPVTAFCSVDGLAGTRVNLISFTQIIGETELYQHYQAPSSFRTREQCRQHAEQISNNDDKIIGTICTDSAPSVLHLLFKK